MNSVKNTFNHSSVHCSVDVKLSLKLESGPTKYYVIFYDVQTFPCYCSLLLRKCESDAKFFTTTVRQNIAITCVHIALLGGIAVHFLHKLCDIEALHLLHGIAQNFMYQICTIRNYTNSI